MNPIGAIAVLAASGLAGLTSPPVAGASLSSRPAAAPSGYVIMIHSTFEPHGNQQTQQLSRADTTLDQLVTGTEYAPGAGATTRDGDYIVFRAIPFAANTVRPVVVRRPQLEVDLVGTGRQLMLEPNAPAAQEPICRVETTWYGSEGPVDACSVYRVPVKAFDGVNVVTCTLHFVDASGPQRRVHNGLAHFMLHMAILGAPIDLRAVDASTSVASPLVVDSAIDTRSGAPSHHRF